MSKELKIFAETILKQLIEIMTVNITYKGVALAVTGLKSKDKWDEDKFEVQSVTVDGSTVDLYPIVDWDDQDYSVAEYVLQKLKS